VAMRRLTLEGVSPADAAKIAIATPLSADGQPMSTPADGYDLTGVPDLGEPTPAAGVTASDEPYVDLSDPSVLAELADLADERREGTGALPDSGVRAARRPGADEGDAQVDALASRWRDEPGRLSAGRWLGVLRSVGTTEHGTAGGGRVVALPEGTPSSRGLARAAMSLDTYETSRMLREAIRRRGVVVTWNSMIMPVLRALGERTNATGDGIDVEHAFSEVILAVMRVVAYQMQPPPGGHTVLLACADADYHSLPLHALAAALAERGIPSRMLGSGLPPEALWASVRRTGPSVIVLFARMSGADAAGTEKLRRQRPAPGVILAGPGWRPETKPSFARTALSLTEAIDEVMRAIHA
jgi:hypothetical protein